MAEVGGPSLLVYERRVVDTGVWLKFGFYVRLGDRRRYKVTKRQEGTISRLSC